MVGRLKISGQAEAVKHIFMFLEKNAKTIETCWFCGNQLPETKLANQGHLTGNHRPGCPFEKLAAAGEECIIARNDDQQTKQAAEELLSQRIDNLFAAMTEEVVPICPFPVCRYPFELGHRLECPFTALQK